MAYKPFKMKGHTLPGIKQRQSPAKQKADTTKTYPKGYTKKDVEFLKEQREDVVRYEDLDEKGKAIWDKLRKTGPSKPIPGPKNKKSLKKKTVKSAFEKALIDKAMNFKKKSPAKQEGPLPEENIKLQKGEHPDTWIYPGKDKFERITDYEDRAEFARSDAESSEGKEKKQHLANAKKLQHEADILRNSKPNKKK